MSEFQARVHYDYLPAGVDRARLFVLTNVRGRLLPLGEAGELAASVVDLSEAEAKTPKWSLRVYACRGRWNAKEGMWTPVRWGSDGEIEVKFQEPFQVLGKGDDYYFVTRSGRLFAAPKPAKGKTRKVEAIWDDPRRRITAFLTDADTGRTFLFCRPAGPGRSPTYFELGGKPRLTPYDPASAKVEADEPLKTVLTCARVLLKDKLIKLPPAKK